MESGNKGVKEHQLIDRKHNFLITHRNQALLKTKARRRKNRKIKSVREVIAIRTQRDLIKDNAKDNGSPSIVKIIVSEEIDAVAHKKKPKPKQITTFSAESKPCAHN